MQTFKPHLQVKCGAKLSRKTRDCKRRFCYVVGQFQSEHPFPLVEMKRRSTKPHETARRRLVLGDASCDFVDRPPPSKQKNFKMTHYQLESKNFINTALVLLPFICSKEPTS